jgi:hypothetical protein
MIKCPECEDYALICDFCKFYSKKRDKYGDGKCKIYKKKYGICHGCKRFHCFMVK